MTNLTPGKAYRFKVIAENFNGFGPDSEAVTIYACTTPSLLEKPNLTSTTYESMSFEWTEPTSDGGCPIIGYAIFRDDGVSGDPTIEIN